VLGHRALAVTAGYAAPGRSQLVSAYDLCCRMAYDLM